jgi:hypothetical protein
MCGDLPIRSGCGTRRFSYLSLIGLIELTVALQLRGIAGHGNNFDDGLAPETQYAAAPECPCAQNDRVAAEVALYRCERLGHRIRVIRFELHGQALRGCLL